ncbi:hypothetical protein ELG77_08925 [Rhizobium leguminosarum]|uniref:hypothetical protein n=1 Tax=Rhizobium leguminosarum TaxID=384 RepID=UPI00102FC670|nr:hypothetical protein [Rhizobium leguminosarum]TBG41884.1 hypothetical protein ELG77_08925 [Rhizobium leguminosarum]
MWWSAIPYVTSGLALVAFVWAVFLTSWLAKLRNERDNVKSALPKDRLRALEVAAEYIGVDLKDIPENERTQIVLRQMQDKAALQKIKISGALLIGVMMLLIVAYAIITPRQPAEAIPAPKATSTPMKGSRLGGETEQSADIIIPPAPGETLKPKNAETWASALPETRESIVTAAVDAANQASDNSDDAPTGEASFLRGWGWIVIGKVGEDNRLEGSTINEIVGVDELQGHIFSTREEIWARIDTPDVFLQANRCFQTGDKENGVHLPKGEKFKILGTKIETGECKGVVLALIGSPER